jgi:hypothetical protein
MHACVCNIARRALRGPNLNLTLELIANSIFLIISRVLTVTKTSSLHMLINVYSSDSGHLSTLRQHLLESRVQDAKTLFDLISSNSHRRCKTENAAHAGQVDDIAR